MEKNRITDEEFSKKMVESQSILESYARQLKSPLVDDLVQDTYVRMWLNRHMYSEEATFKAWAKKVMKNVFITQAVKDDRMKYNRDEDNEWTIFDYITSLKSYNEAFSNVTIDDIYESIERILKPKDQFIVKEFLNGVSQSEIGITLSKKRNNIKQRYFHAIREVREDLKDKFGIDDSEYKQSDNIIKKQTQYHKKAAQEEYVYRRNKFKE